MDTGYLPAVGLEMRVAARRDRLEGQVRATLDKLGVTSFPISARGIPDLLCFHGRRAFLIEVKDPAETLTPSQKVFHHRAALGGWPVFMVRNVEQVVSVLKIIRA